jgi:hypothetical protein
MFTTRTLSIFGDTSRRQILRVRQKEPVKKLGTYFTAILSLFQICGRHEEQEVNLEVFMAVTIGETFLRGTATCRKT